MGFLINETKMINDNAFLFEDRLNSQYARFLDKAPVFVTYYGINNIESTVDNGLKNVERSLGDNSPIRFKQVNDFPIYGLDAIIPTLSLEDQGLDGSYDADGVILPNTIIPQVNDFFTIKHIGHDFLFMVTEIAYDSIKSNNFYKISFTLKSTDIETWEMLAKQTNESYECILNNIGTEEKCLIKSSEKILLNTIGDIYDKIAEQYLVMFFDKRYNSFLLPDMTGTFSIYDKYLTQFISNTGVFNNRNDLETVRPSNEDDDKYFLREYHRSIYYAVEQQDKELIVDNMYLNIPVSSFTSVFNLYRDDKIKSSKLGIGSMNYMGSSLLDSIKSGIVEDEAHETIQIIADFFNGTIQTLGDLPVKILSKHFVWMDYDRETFIHVPIILSILRTQFNNFMIVK